MHVLPEGTKRHPRHPTIHYWQQYSTNYKGKDMNVKWVRAVAILCGTNETWMLNKEEQLPFYAVPTTNKTWIWWMSNTIMHEGSYHYMPIQLLFGSPLYPIPSHPIPSLPSPPPIPCPSCAIVQPHRHLLAWWVVELPYGASPHWNTENLSSSSDAVSADWWDVVSGWPLKSSESAIVVLKIAVESGISIVLAIWVGMNSSVLVLSICMTES
jgi:hypothetical protein